MTLKERFLYAIQTGQLGETTKTGTYVNLKDFKAYFSDIDSDYINSFMPASVIETGQHSATHNRFLFRVSKGLYKVHPEALNFTGVKRAGSKECT